MQVDARVREHYELMWQTPGRVARFDILGAPMEVYKWPAESTGEGVALYATNGASAVVASTGGVRVEFFVGLMPEFDDIVSSLSLLGSYPLQGGAASAGDTVTLGDPLWPGAATSTFLLVPQTDWLVEPLPLPDGSHVHFHQVLPISASELALKRQCGAIWLLAELNDEGIPTWQHQRRYL
ncbi:hypothetical protein GCM10010435_97290 [Winogradskya consettensis]|uniref:Suppressor of fused-like domain-containing protein n=1 Tax=Winogradskya consettensis TaxID=113560 RepID=A0A919VY68_9ACTN|nr:suppressor of fused domain protein [Actinoplanes consettensis]GIM73408.1 hypothetical protein Aco04nite_35100 [Actinoplanes consettensis]